MIDRATQPHKLHACAVCASSSLHVKHYMPQLQKLTAACPRAPGGRCYCPPCSPTRYARGRASPPAASLPAHPGTLCGQRTTAVRVCHAAGQPCPAMRRSRAGPPRDRPARTRRPCTATPGTPARPCAPCAPGSSCGGMTINAQNPRCDGFCEAAITATPGTPARPCAPRAPKQYYGSILTYAQETLHCQPCKAQP